jgi:hypothetical protein
MAYGLGKSKVKIMVNPPSTGIPWKIYLFYKN